MDLDNVVIDEEVKELSESADERTLVVFNNFSGIDGKLYFGEGRTLEPEHYRVVGATSLAVAPGGVPDLVVRAVEKRRIRESNACVISHEFSFGSDSFVKNSEHRRVGSSERYDVFSVVYLRVNEEELEKFKP